MSDILEMVLLQYGSAFGTAAAQGGDGVLGDVGAGGSLEGMWSGVASQRQ